MSRWWMNKDVTWKPEKSWVPKLQYALLGSAYSLYAASWLSSGGPHTTWLAGVGFAELVAWWIVDIKYTSWQRREKARIEEKLEASYLQFADEFRDSLTPEEE